MSFFSVKIDSTAKKLVVMAALLVAAVFNFVFGKWALANMAAQHAAVVEAAEFTKELAPDDPQAHYATAVLKEKSFLPDDFDASLNEYTRAAALAPANYLFWLDLGNARSRSGDLAGAEKALRVTAGLAPNYSTVNWALGNVLLREQKMDEAFSLLGKAAVANPHYAAAGANMAWQYFGGDITQIKSAVGDSPEINSALIPLLVSQKRTDEALVFWKALKGDKTGDSLRPVGKSLSNQLLAEKRFRDALDVEVDIATGERPAAEKIANGDFESEIKTQNASIFEWAIANGSVPQIAPTNGQKHGGALSLLIAFGQDGSNDFRQVSQTIAVVPGKAYELSGFYKSELKTAADLHWEIANAADGKTLATAPRIAQADWTPFAVAFSVPPGVDGIILRLVKAPCSGACTIAGRIWFDDLTLNSK